MLFGLGGVTFLAGIALLVIGGMSALSGDDSGPPGAESVVDLTITPSPRPTRAPATEEASTPTPVPEPPLGDSPYTMQIGSIGVSAPVDEYGLDENAVPIVPTGSDAADVVAWYNFSARPGTGSNAVFAGHVTWNGPGVFYRLTSVKAGDTIQLRGQDGTELEYVVTEVFSVNPSIDENARDVMLPTEKDVITIITCSGSFTANPNDPTYGGDYNERLVVRGDLVTVTPGSAVAAAGG
jgi:LPXTG-site transpeptidase (sortase) family protein